MPATAASTDTLQCYPLTFRSDACALDPEDYASWGVCETWQRPIIEAAAAAQPDAQAMAAFSPCDMDSMLAPDRTLWVIGCVQHAASSSEYSAHVALQFAAVEQQRRSQSCCVVASLLLPHMLNNDLTLHTQ